MAPGLPRLLRYWAARHLGKIVLILRGKKWSLYLLIRFGSCFTVQGGSIRLTKSSASVRTGIYPGLLP